MEEREEMCGGRLVFTAETDRVLMQLCEEWKRDTGERSIMWREVSERFSIRFPLWVLIRNSSGIGIRTSAGPIEHESR